jgi:hypothetical protein
MAVASSETYCVAVACPRNTGVRINGRLNRRLRVGGMCHGDQLHAASSQWYSRSKLVLHYCSPSSVVTLCVELHRMRVLVQGHIAGGHVCHNTAAVARCSTTKAVASPIKGKGLHVIHAARSATVFDFSSGFRYSHFAGHSLHLQRRAYSEGRPHPAALPGGIAGMAHSPGPSWGSLSLAETSLVFWLLIDIAFQLVSKVSCMPNRAGMCRMVCPILTCCHGCRLALWSPCY